MSIFAFIKKNISIESVISEYTTLKRAGNYLKARCPFHHEKTASFTISPSKEIFYCFGCHKGGDVVSFVSLFEKCSQREAAILLAERYHLTLPETEQKELGSRDAKDRYFHICSVVHEWVLEQYKQSQEVKQYVQSRGLSPKIVKQFSLGYFPHGQHAIKSLIQFAHKKSVLVKELVSAHILFSHAEQSYTSPFEDRLIIPILDTLGRICAFGGRIFKAGDTRAKYYNSHENEFFIKGTLLFGLSLAKEQIRNKRAVFVVEGYMDCIMMAQYGYTSTVATLGTACTEAHLKQLSRYSDTVYIMYDGDDAGTNALLRIAEKCWRSSVDPIVLSLPKGEDPASYLVKEKTLDPIIKQGKNIFSFFISLHAQSLGQKTLGEKVQMVKSILEVILTIEDPIKQTLLLSQASTALAIDESVLKKELKRMQDKQEQKEEKKSLAVEKLQERQQEIIEEHEQEEEVIQILLGYMIQNPSCLDSFLIQLCTFSKNEGIRTLCDQLLQIIKNDEHQEYSFDKIWGALQESQQQFVSALIMQKQVDIDLITFKTQAQQFERQMFKRVVNSFKVQIARSMKEKDQGKTESLLQQLVETQKRFKRET